MMVTTGFSIKQTNGSSKASTAGHCGNVTSYGGQDLPWQAGSRRLPS